VDIRFLIGLGLLAFLIFMVRKLATLPASQQTAQPRRNPKSLAQNRSPQGPIPVGERGGPWPYVDGLLTVLARGGVDSVTLASQRGLPRLTELSTNPQCLEYVSSIPAIDASYGADYIIGLLIGLSRGPNPRGPRHADTEVKTVLTANVAGGDGTLQPVSFALHMTVSNDERQLVITRN